MRLVFGDCAVDFGTRELFRAGKPVHLSPKAFLLLELLIEKRPDALSKAAIHEKIWPKSFVSEATLASLIAEIREAIGEGASGAQSIRTVHGFGYAFAGAASEAPTSPPRERESAWSLVWDDREIRLPEGETILGRDHSAGVCVPSERVSRRHARLLIAGGTATIEDLGSKNGTYREGKRLEKPEPLRDGDEVRIGPASMRVRALPAGGTTKTQTEHLN